MSKSAKPFQKLRKKKKKYLLVNKVCAEILDSKYLVYMYLGLLSKLFLHVFFFSFFLFFF